jgi:hypothetical protein
MSDDLQRQTQARMPAASRLLAAGAPEGDARWKQWEQEHGDLTVTLAMQPHDAVRGTEQA